MKVHTIDVDKLKREGDLCSLWFQYDGGDLYLLISPNHVDYFEFTLDDQHLEGGFERSFRFGKVFESHSEEGAYAYKRSRLVEYNDELSGEFLKWCQRFMHECPNVEAKLKEGIIEYLVHEGSKPQSLQLEEGEFYESYRGPIEPKAAPKNLKKIKKYVSYLVIFLLIVSFSLFVNFLRNKASNAELIKNCQSGDSSACKEVESAGILTLNKKAVLENATSVRNHVLDKDILECYKSSGCDLNQFKKFKKDKIHFWFYKSCLENKYKPSCAVAISFVYSDFSKIDSRLQDSVKILASYCDQNKSYLCNEYYKMKKYLKARVKCHVDAQDSGCVTYLKHLMDRGYDRVLYPEAKRLCDLNNGEICFKLGLMLTKDQELTKAEQIRQSRELWKKACFDLNNFDSCFYFSWESGKKIEFKEHKHRSDLLKKCKRGDEDACQNLLYIARLQI